MTHAVFHTDEGWIVDHELLLDDVFRAEIIQEDKKFRLKFRSEFFDLRSPFLRDLQALKLGTDMEKGVETQSKRRKRKRQREDVSNQESEHHAHIEQAFSKIVEQGKSAGHFSAIATAACIKANNITAREAAKTFSETYSGVALSEKFSGSNNSELPVIHTFSKEVFVIPPQSHYFCDDVRNLSVLVEENTRFDCIVIDPPWWNKHVRRKNAAGKREGYDMMYNSELESLPIPALAKDDALVAVWCTNAESHNRDLLDIFANWRVTYCSTWYWLKVTKSGDPICPLSQFGKKPYERILFGKYSNNCGNIPEDGKIIVSVPSSIHSHKPPLHELLKNYLADHSQCLELFARSLYPGWTSWGNEVLKLQHISLYSKLPC